MPAETQAKRVEVDRSKVRTAINAGIPLSLTTYTLPHEMEVYMDDILRAFLEELNQTQMIEYLSYCLSELITNAKKANTKRVYFKFKKLDITNQADYELGMKTFKDDTLNDINCKKRPAFTFASFSSSATIRLRSKFATIRT